GGGMVGGQHVNDINGVARPGVKRGGVRTGGVGILDDEGVGAAAQGNVHGTCLGPPVEDVRRGQVADDVKAHAWQDLPGRQPVEGVAGVVDVQHSTAARVLEVHRPQD